MLKKYLLLELCTLLVLLCFSCGNKSIGTSVDQNTVEATSDCIDRNKINPEQMCTRVYKPVCGCNEVTYSNECEAEKAGVTSWKEGRCSE